MKFYALDVETANPDYSSICQLGISTFSKDKLIGKWKSYINPEDYFDGFNVSIHGIDEYTVKDAPIFSEIYFVLNEMLENQIVVHHSPFDRIAVHRASEKYSLKPININWLDSAKVTRRTWEECSQSGYALKKIAKKLNINYEPHDALEDSIVAGKIVIEAQRITGMGLLDLIERVKKPINLIPYGKKIKIEGNPNGPLFGENLVFTGALMITRLEAAKIAAELGCNVSNGITKDTTLLVLGKQDALRLKGKDKSSKHLKAEKLIQSGCHIKIIAEDDFLKMAEIINE